MAANSFRHGRNLGRVRRGERRACNRSDGERNGVERRLDYRCQNDGQRGQQSMPARTRFLLAGSGETPRQAVKTKKGRAQVVGWLKLLENSEFRRAAGQGHNPYDTAWMWRELKVEDSR